jgi:hypothetical protein
MALFGPYFFEEGGTVIVNSDQYMAMLEIFLQNELNLCQLNSVWFHQNGVTTHSAQISFAVLRKLFPGRLISCFGHINWPNHP